MALNCLHPNRASFDMEAGVGKASRWNTLRALRVLDWYGKLCFQDGTLPIRRTGRRIAPMTVIEWTLRRPPMSVIMKDCGCRLPRTLPGHRAGVGKPLKKEPAGCRVRRRRDPYGDLSKVDGLCEPSSELSGDGRRSC